MSHGARGAVVAALLLLAAPSAGPSAAVALAADEMPKGAAELEAEIESALKTGGAKNLNGALVRVGRLADLCKDDAAKAAVGLDDLLQRVVEQRDGFFRVEVAKVVHEEVKKLIDAKVAENRPRRAAAGAAPVPPWTLAQARAWLVKDLPSALWDSVRKRLELTSAEVEEYWKSRRDVARQTASYGTGSYLVNRQGPWGPPAGVPTDEQWWASAPAAERSSWLRAYFAEKGALFVVLRIDESSLCSACGGTGAKKSLGADGSESSVVCPMCHAGGHARGVEYR